MGSASQGHMGWVKGLEPSTLGTTIRCSNQLSYTHHIFVSPVGRWHARRDSLFCGKATAVQTIHWIVFKSRLSNPWPVPHHTLARQEGFEPPAYCLEGSCSIQLSYWRIGDPFTGDCPVPKDPSKKGLERVMGIEPTCSAWKADILPLNYTRGFSDA